MVRKLGVEILVCVGLACMFGAQASAEHHNHHEGDFIVGRTAGLHLAMEGPVDHVIVLEPSTGLLPGWVGAEPGFEALEMDELDEGFFTLGAEASIWLEVVSLDAGLKVWQGDAGAVAAAPGEKVLLGGNDLHSHVFWHIDSTVSGIGPDWEGTLAGTFRLVDTGGTNYAASEPFTLQVSNVPEPVTLALLGLSGVALLRRRQIA